MRMTEAEFAGLANKPKPNVNCKVCGERFYASPGHLAKGWGTSCSLKCRTQEKPNPRFVENDVACKSCGKSFHVKPSAAKNGKGKVYCSDNCRIEATSASKICPQCGTAFAVPKSHIDRTQVHCSRECRSKAALCGTPNCTCKTCGTKFYTKPCDLKRGIECGIENGVFCSVACMTGSRGKNRLEDGKYASHLEAEMMLYIRSHNLQSGLVREFRFHPKRKWLIDFAYPDKKIGIEVHGGIWNGKFGGHTSGSGRMRDMEKMNEASLLGWRIIEVASNHIKNGQAIEWLKKLIEIDS